jgi:protocatechuate 3,4-dioxygenase beta subunit
MRTAVLFLLLGGALAAQQGSIEGVVLNQANGQPLPGVHVRMFAGMIAESATQAYGAMTDAGGHYSIAAMPPGTYTVELDCTGFLQVPGTGFSNHIEIDLRPGEHLAGRQLGMWPLIAIAGRVVNQNGDPVAGAQVQASTEAVRAGVVNSGAIARIGPYGAKTTDERGQFRLFAPPGKYYLVAGAPMSVSAFGPAEIRTDGTTDLAYTSTYYPDASDASAATMVEAKPGSEVTGLEIHLRSGAVRRNLSVSGIVTGIPAGFQAIVAYQFGETPDRVSTGNSNGRVGPDGRFSFDYLSPGYLRLMARCSPGEAELQSDVVEVHLEPPGASGIQLALTPGGAVTGTLEIVGDGPAAPAGKVVVKLSPTGGIGFTTPLPTRQLSGAVDQDGAFRIAGVTPGSFQVGIDPMPENGYIKEVLLNGNAVNDGTLDLSHGVRGPHIKVTVSHNGAQISGEVRDADGGALLNPNVMVSLMPEADPTAATRRAVFVVEGHYTLKGIAPGKYKICAVDIFRTPPAGRPAGSSCSAFPAASESLEIAEGAHVIKDLKAAAQEATNAQPKQ